MMSNEQRIRKLEAEIQRIKREDTQLNLLQNMSPALLTTQNTGMKWTNHD